MSRHDPSNNNCDKVRYAGADGVLCTCEFDSPDDAPVPSTVASAFASGVALDTQRRSAGDVLLSGCHAASYLELQAATRDLEAAKALLRPAEQRWRAALDRFHAEMLR
jgi:hypothetical protein